MEELSTIFGNVGILVAALAGGISLVMFGFAGIQYMTAPGRPPRYVQGQDVSHRGRGRPGHRWPRLRNARDHQPPHHRAGGRREDRQRGADGLRPTAPEPARVPAGRIHRWADDGSHTADPGQRDDCVSELWNPEVVDSNSFGTTGCFATAPTYHTGGVPLVAKVGD